MTSALGSINSTQKNTCPHGLPSGACPICSGMGGGGGVDRKHTRRKPGELTYAECAAIGARMKAQKEAKEARLEHLQHNSRVANLRAQTLKFLSKIQSTLSQIQKNLPEPLAKTFSQISTILIKPIINAIKGISSAIQTVANFINEFKGQIISTLEKLTVIIGEVKNFINSKIKDRFKKIKRKIFSLFGFSILETNEEEDILKEFEIRESQKIKNLILKLFAQNKEQNEHKQSENDKNQQL